MKRRVGGCFFSASGLGLGGSFNEAYSAAGKTYLHEQVENQKEHAI